MSESSRDTLKREMREELGVEVVVERLIWVLENFFEDEGKSYHELALYFLIDLPHDSHLFRKRGPFAGVEEGIKLILKWHELDKLEKIPLKPTFLAKFLKSLPKVTEHIVHTNRKIFTGNSKAIGKVRFSNPLSICTTATN